MAEPARRLPTYADYLAREVETGVRHEWRGGELVAMAGGSVAHADLGLNVALALRTALDGRPCRPSNADQRLRIPDLDLSTYPDVAVYCGPRERDVADPDALVNPTALVEVLSPSTEGYDRGEKFSYYRRIPTLRHYVLVATTAARVEVYTRNADGVSWTLRAYGPGEVAPLDAIGAELAVDRVYDGVELELAARPAPR